ncbi:hypothetical protein OTU49_007073, partial [Cherax quadricarinatus]
MRLTVLLLAVSTLSAGCWAGSSDAINTERGGEEPLLQQQQHHPALPRGEEEQLLKQQQQHLTLHPHTPLLAVTLHAQDAGHSDSEVRSGQDDPRVFGSSSQSSTSQQYLQSSSLGGSSVDVSGALWSDDNNTPERQPFHLSELLSSSSAQQVSLWPDPPHPPPPTSATGTSSSLPPVRGSDTPSSGDLAPRTFSHNTHKTEQRQDVPFTGNRNHRRLLQESPRIHRVNRTPRINRKHLQAFTFGGMPLNARYLKTNIQIDRGKLSPRKRLKEFAEERESSVIDQENGVKEESEEYQHDGSQTFPSSQEESGVSELLPAKRNVTSQQAHEHSKEIRHEKLTRDFPAQLTKQEESTERFSKENKLREVNEGARRDSNGEITNTVNRGVESLADSSRDPSLNETASDRPQKVNLDTLEMELSEKEEEAASDLLLAISILQHHLVPDTSPPRREAHAHNALSQALVDHSRFSDSSEPRRAYHMPHNAQENSKKFNIEIFDTLSPGSDEVVGEVELMEANSVHHTTNLQEEADLRERAGSRYRWFVLVLVGNCSVIKPRMTTFVTFLKAALSAKLSIDYNDVFVPSVFCDNTFMVNISLNALKYPQVEVRLRKLAEANTTLLEISEEIFYLEKILTKRSDEEEPNFQTIIKKPDDVELVIYIAVGCMCVFILLSVVIVMLIRLCRQDGDTLDLGKPHPHQIIPRSLDFPIRRPNVIYSHRFSQALIPGKCGRRGLEEGQTS